MTIKIPVEVATKGIQQTIAEFQAMQKSLGTIAKNSAGFDTLARSMGSTYKEAKTLATSLGMTGQAAASTVQGIKQLTAVGANSAAQFQILSGKLGITATQFQAISAAMNATKGNITAATAGNISLANAMGGSYNQAQKLATGLGMSSEKAAAAVTRLKDLNAVNVDAATKFATLQKELGVTAEQFKQLDQVASSTQQGMGAVAAVSGAITGVIGATFAKGTAEFIDFDKAMKQSGVVSGSIGTPQLAGLRQEVERLGVVTSKSPAEVAKMTVSLSRAGFTATESKAAIEGIVRASEATGESLEVVGDIVAKTVRTFGLAASDSMKVGDILTATANNTNTTVSGLGESLKYVGPAAAAAGQPLEDVAVLLGLLGDAGIQGSQAGTNLASALEALKIASAGGQTEFSNLVRGSARATAAFNAIGAEVRNADGSMKSVLDILPVIQNNLGQLGQADQDILMKALFGTEGGRAFQTLLNAAPDRIDLVTGKIREAEGISKEKGQEMLAGLDGALSLLDGSVGAATAKFGEFVAVGLEPMVRGATNLINAFLALPGPVQTLLVATTGFVGVMSAAVAAIAAYNLAKGAQIVAEFKAASMTVLGTGALLQKKVAMLANVVVIAAVTAGEIALAIATGNFAAAQKLATAATLAAAPAMKALAATMITVLPAVIALGAAFALIAVVDATAKLKEVNEELDVLANNSTNSMNEFGQIAGRVKGLNNAFKETGQFTEEQKRLAQGYIKISKEKIAAIEAEIAAAKEIADNPNASPEQKSAAEAAVAGLQAQKQALEAQTKTLEANVAATGKRTQAVQDAKSAEEALKAVTEGLEDGTVNEADAIKQLEAIKNNANAGAKAQKAAADEILKIREAQSSGELALLDASRSEIEAKVKAGTLSEAAAQKQLTEISRQEIQKRLDLNKQKLANATGSERDELLAEQRKLQSELTTLEAEQEATRNKQLIENYDERRDILEGQYAQGKVSRADYNKQILSLDLKQNDEELKQAREQLSKLDASDTEGREAINAKIGQLMQKRADITRAAYQRELQAVEEANDKALDAVKLSETQRQIEIATLRKSGSITAQKAEEMEAQSTKERIDAEIAAEQKKMAAMQAMKAANPEDEAKRQDDIRSSQQKLAELTLQRVNQEIAAEERLRQVAIAAIKERQQAQQLATDSTVRGIRAEIGELSKQNNAHELSLKSLDREQKLRESGLALVKAQTDAEINRAEAQISTVNAAMSLVKDAKTDPRQDRIDELKTMEEQAKTEGEKKRIAEESQGLQSQIAAEQKQAAEQQKQQQQQIIAALGLAGKTELELLQRRQALEDRQAAAKDKALMAEMAMARAQMEMNVKRMAIEAKMQLIAAKRAEFEAKISVEKSKQAVLDAKAELEQAKLIQDPKERKAAEAAAKGKIKDAELDAKLTQEEYAFAKENTQFAAQNIEDTKLMAKQQQETLAIQQQSAIEVSNQEEGLRTMNQALELSKVGAEGFAGAMEKAARSASAIQDALGSGSPTAPQARRLGGSVRAGEPYLVGEAGPELITPSRNGWVFTAKQTAKILADVQPANAAALPTGTISQIVAFRRDAAMLEELKKLRGQVESMRPVQERNTFNLNSNQLVADAAELHLKIARNRLRRSRR